MLANEVCMSRTAVYKHVFVLSKSC